MSPKSITKMRKSGTSVEMELDNVWINKGTNNGF
jgi:hypothetical protein